MGFRTEALGIDTSDVRSSSSSARLGQNCLISWTSLSQDLSDLLLQFEKRKPREYHRRATRTFPVTILICKETERYDGFTGLALFVIVPELFEPSKQLRQRIAVIFGPFMLVRFSGNELTLQLPSSGMAQFSGMEGVEQSQRIAALNFIRDAMIMAQELDPDLHQYSSMGFDVHEVDGLRRTVVADLK